MLRVNKYTNTKGKATYSIELFHNNTYTHKGVYDELAYQAFLRQSSYKNITLVNVRSKVDLKPFRVV